MARGFKESNVRPRPGTYPAQLPKTTDEKLLTVRRCVWERIVEAMAIPFRGVHKSVEIFLDIDRLEEQAFVTNRLGVFDQNSCGTIDAPHLKSRPKKSA